MHTQTLELRRLTLNDFERAVEVQSSAFFSDPLWRYLVPDEARRTRLLRGVFRPTVRLGILSGGAYGVGAPTDAFAIWNAPGDKVPLSVFVQSGFFRLAFNPALLATFGRAVPIFGRFEQMQKRYAPEPHYYLSTISVAPEAQGRGLASKLIRPFLAKADAEGVSAYTETMTPENVGLYEHYGFRMVEQYHVPNTDLSIWAFYRPARAEGSTTP